MRGINSVNLMRKENDGEDQKEDCSATSVMIRRRRCIRIQKKFTVKCSVRVKFLANRVADP
jgi:hypothetical protein